jgi:hypothetical protein
MARNNVLKFRRDQPAKVTRVIGTKITPGRALIPYGEREFIEGAFRPCRFCKHWFTFLGRGRHENKCPENPEVKKQKRKPR